MRFFIYNISIFLFLLGSADSFARNRRPSPTPKNYKSGEIIVKFKEQYVNTNAFKSSLASKGAKIKKMLNNRGLSRLSIDKTKSVDSAIEEILQDDSVEFAQPNYIYRKSATPSDTKYSLQWGLKNTGQTIPSAYYNTNNPGMSGKDIDAETAWNYITDCSAITVAVIDTGINYNHEDLSTNMWDGGGAYPNHGYDFVDSDNDPMDLNGHGTHVAGIIGAKGNNGTGSTGVCWQSKLMAIRVLDASGSGYTSDIVSGINFAVSNGAKVINLSLGQSSYDAALNTAINSASSSGAVIVVAAGNDGSNNDGGDTVYPCNFTASNLVCVAALDQSFQLASFSNYGSSSVDVGAPGANIESLTTGTFTETADTFGSGWTLSGWGTGTRTMSSGTSYSMLMSPSNWNRSSAKYTNSLDAKAYKTFDLSGADSATLEYYAFIDTQSGDYFYTAYKTSAGDPFSAGTLIDQISTSTGGYADYYSYDMKNCLIATCSIGFRLSSNASGVDYGIGLLEFYISTLSINNNSYENMSGTSMAAPMVSGIAAMLFAYNTSYTASDVVASIKNAGATTSSLQGKSTSGKAAKASSSLKYIIAPTGISATAH